MSQAVVEESVVRIGEYVLTGKIGQGGIAEVYRGRQESLERDVAIKIISADMLADNDIVRRFERESMVIARLNHPNIVHVIDRGKAAGRCYFVMEFVDGPSYRDIIDSPKVPVTTKLDLLIQVCKALDYAHKNGVIHRDIKPTNILVDREGNAKVADFGIAQLIESPESELTAGDVVLGTAAYMSPEQKISSTNVDHTTDLYAVGVMLYEILTGRKPQGRFKLPSELNPSVPKGYDIIITKCLAQEPKDRYRNAVELKDALLECQMGKSSQATPADQTLSGADSFIGRCRYLDTIKETSFGSTFLVEHSANKTLYILKKHQRGDAGRKEAKLLATLKHPNIIGIYGAGGDNRGSVIVTEYAPGGSLADRMVRPWEWRPAMELIAQVAAGLDFAHRNSIVHGNLRPSNILFDHHESARLTDFGMPVHYDSSRSSKRNWYGPPERKASRAGDIYSMGAILHHLITGRTPEYDHGGNLLLTDLRGRFPHAIETILRKLLALRVSQRYQTAEAMLADWQTFLQELVDGASRSVLPEIEKEAAPVRRPPWGYFFAGAAVVVIVLLVLYLTGVFSR